LQGSEHTRWDRSADFNGWGHAGGTGGANDVGFRSAFVEVAECAGYDGVGGL